MQTTVSTTPLLGKGQHCKTPIRIVLTAEEQRTRHAGRSEVRFNHHMLQWQAHCPRCTEHGHWIWLVPVRGTHNARKTCNAKCLGATGPACDCSCAGENHGGHHTH
jgi:hypothetical protein